MHEKYILAVEEKAEELGWECYRYSFEYKGTRSIIEFRKHSPVGEDFFFELDANEFLAENVRWYEKNFDTEEHIMMWVVAKQNGSVSGIPDIKTLVRDADDIKQMLKELADAVENIWHCTGCAYFDACGNYEKTEHCNGRKLVK